MATLESLYKVHLLGWEGDDNLTIEQFFNRLLGPVVQDVTRTFINGTPKMEDTWTVRFQSKTCPERLVNVRKLNTAGHGTIYLRHPKTDIRKPCQKCLSILHTERGCKSEHMEQLRAKYERTVVGFVPVTAGLHRYDSSQGTLADFLAAVEQAGVISNAPIDADDGSQALYFEGENAAAPRPSPSGFVAPELQEVSKRGEWKLLHSPPCSPQGQIHLSPEDDQDDGFVTHSSKSAKRNQRRAKRKAAQGADMAAAARAADQQMKAVQVRNLSKKAADQRMRSRMTGHVQPTNCTPEKQNTKDSPIPPQAGKTNPGRTGSVPAQTPTVEQSNAGPLTVRAKTEKENPEVNQATSAMVLTAALPVAPTPCRTRPQLVAATFSEQMQELSAAEIHEGAHTLQRTAAEGMEVDLQSGNGSSNKQARDRGEKTTMSVEEAEQHAPPSPGKKTKREVKPQPPTCPKKAAPDMLQKAKEQLKEKKSKSPKARSRPPSPSKMAHSMLVPAMSEGDQASGGAESGTASSATLATAEITLIHGDTTGTLRSIGGPSKATRRLFAWPRVNGNDGEDRGPRVRQFRADKRGIQTSLHQYLHPASPSTIDLTTQSLDQHQAELGGQSSTDTTSPLQTTSPRIISTIPGVATAEKLDSWLKLLGGEVTDVEGNGQCGFLAYYAATVQAGPGLLNMNAEVVKEATNLKRSVIDLALADLHGSIRLGAFDPEAEYVRLFPNPVGTDEPQPWAAAQAIVKYLIMEQGRSIMQRTPPEHWVGPMMLKAMAQLRREPLYVIDVNANGTTSVQRYLYHHDQLPNVAGESPRSLEFEAGYVQLIPAAAAKTIFQRYIDHKALPLVLILHHTTGGGHFNAVNYGHRFQQWCGNNPDEMRLRIHACHQHSQDTNYPDTLLDMEGIVREAIVSRQAIAEEAALESKHPPILRVPDVPTDESDGSHLPPRSGVYRAPHRDHWERYEDLLRVKATTQEPSVLTRYRKRLQQENHTAFVAWTTSQAQSSEFPTRKAANMSIADATLWFVSHAAVCRSLLRHLPHPEIVVIEFEKPQLMAWADSEIFERQLAAIRQMQIGDCPDELKEAAHQWGQRCGQGTTEAERLAAACPLSWKKLRDDFPTWVPPMARPAAIQGDEWRVLHLLPWLVKRWKHTMIAAAQDQSLARSYLVHSDVAQACSHAASREDWSLLLHLRETTCAEAGAPSSPIWAERRGSN
ncbi:hypothetical protein BBJ28_00019683 [Nothophytophthora sp. Chile5]|nr:hypothetical protein BBJ28_00019683 [Nothophytophthora sp. Chile5]